MSPSSPLDSLIDALNESFESEAVRRVQQFLDILCGR